jgi:hypothetical protein
VPALVAGLAASELEVRTACADALAAIGPEGRDRLAHLAAGAGAAAVAARAALDAVALRSPRPQAVTG